MQSVLSVVVLGRAVRAASGQKNRQPLPALYATGEPLGEEYANIIADELNVKKVEFTDDTRAYTTYNIKPQLRTMGPKYGKHLKAIGEYLKTVDGNAVMDAFQNEGVYRFEVGGTTVEMAESDALCELTQKSGFVASSDKGLTVVLDTNLTEALVEEGFVRELISKVQTMRKEAGFEVTDRIRLTYEGSEKIASLFARFGGEICRATLAAEAAPGSAGYMKEWNINGEPAKLGVEKV